MNSLLKPVEWVSSRMTDEIKIYSGSGNVFTDLGLPNPDELLIKAELAHQISELISERQLTIQYPSSNSCCHGMIVL